MRLSTSKAIITGAILASVIVTVGAKVVGGNIWSALTAIGTVGAVIWAIFHQGISERLRKPKLIINPYEEDPPYLRPVPTGTTENPVTSYILTFKLLNAGEAIAEKAQPLLTRVWSFEKGKWKPQEGWVPVPLRWVFDEIAQQATDLEIPTDKGPAKYKSFGKPTEEKDLVQHRPYLFSLGELSTRHPETFELLGLIFSRSQRNSYDAGEYCFEITVFSQRVDPKKKYVRLTWSGGCTGDFEELKKKVRIQLSDIAPTGITR